jgi:putative membrane protein
VPKRKADIHRLSRLNGAHLTGHTYMQDMIKEYEEDVAEFKRVSENASDPDLKAFAGKTLPTLQDHLRQARETEGQLKK